MTNNVTVKDFPTFINKEIQQELLSVYFKMSYYITMSDSEAETFISRDIFFIK